MYKAKNKKKLLDFLNYKTNNINYQYSKGNNAWNLSGVCRHWGRK